MLRRLLTLALVWAALAPLPTHAELPEAWQAWNEPIEPFRIAANLYYVGTREIAVYLFVTPQGHILLDGGFEESVPHIRASIERLGYRLEDVRLLLNSHAHGDHAGGLAELARLTGADFLASAGDADLLRGGGDDVLRYPPVEPTRLFDDGEVVELAGTRLVARITPGHTPGCTTWTTALREGLETYDTVFVCSVNVLPGMELGAVTPAFPEGRAAAFRSAFEILDELPVDIFLGAHASFFYLEGKLESPDPAPLRFVDPDLYRRHVERKRERFEEAWAEESSATPRVSAEH